MLSFSILYIKVCYIVLQCYIILYHNMLYHVILYCIILYRGCCHLTDMRSCYSGLQSEGPPRDEHNSDTKRGVASAMKPPDKKKGLLSPTPTSPTARSTQPTSRPRTGRVHPVSITRFPLTRFSPGSGLLRNRFCLHYQR